MKKCGSKVRIMDKKWIENLQIKDFIGWEGKSEDNLPFLKKLASGIGEIRDGYFGELPAVFVKFGQSNDMALLVVPKMILECVN